METNHYKVLLIIAGLASYTRFGFKIKPTAWRRFLGGQRERGCTTNHQREGGSEAIADATINQGEHERRVERERVRERRERDDAIIKTTINHIREREERGGRVMVLINTMQQ